MATQNKTSKEIKIERSTSVKPRPHKNESPLKPEEKPQGAAKPSIKTKGPARATSKKTTQRKTVSKTPPTKKKINISIDEAAKPAIVSNTKNDSADETKERLQEASSTREKSTNNQSQSPIRYGVESGEIIAKQLIRANCKVCMFWLDAVSQLRNKNLERMVLNEEVGQMADEMARGLLETGTDYAHNTVRQVAEIANAGISNFEGMQVENASLFDFKKVFQFNAKI